MSSPRRRCGVITAADGDLHTDTGLPPGAEDPGLRVRHGQGPLGGGLTHGDLILGVSADLGVLVAHRLLEERRQQVEEVRSKERSTSFKKDGHLLAVAKATGVELRVTVLLARRMSMQEMPLCHRAKPVGLTNQAQVVSSRGRIKAVS